MRLSRLLPLVLGVMVASGAQAQTFSYSPPGTVGGNAGLFAGRPVDLDRSFLNTTVTYDNGRGTSQEFVRLSDLLTATQGPNSTGLISIASRLDRLSDRFREGIALAGAVNVLPPNPGDRFAVTFGGAGYDGAGAASVAVSARLNEGTIAYVGYARGPTQNLVKGGVGFSFK